MWFLSVLEGSLLVLEFVVHDRTLAFTYIISCSWRLQYHACRAGSVCLKIRPRRREMQVPSSPFTSSFSRKAVRMRVSHVPDKQLLSVHLSINSIRFILF